MKKTVTRYNLAESIYQEIGLTRKDSAEILGMAIEEMKKALVKGEGVKIPHFGTFGTHYKTARIGRNPKTKIDAEISPRMVVFFRASKFLREAVNK